jgi:hypothetical protein
MILQLNPNQLLLPLKNNKPKPTNNKILKVGNRASILFDGKDWYDRIVSHIDRDIQMVKYDNKDTDRHKFTHYTPSIKNQ